MECESRGSRPKKLKIEWKRNELKPFHELLTPFRQQMNSNKGKTEESCAAKYVELRGLGLGSRLTSSTPFSDVTPTSAASKILPVCGYGCVSTVECCLR